MAPTQEHRNKRNDSKPFIFFYLEEKQGKTTKEINPSKIIIIIAPWTIIIISRFRRFRTTGERNICRCLQVYSDHKVLILSTITRYIITFTMIARIVATKI